MVRKSCTSDHNAASEIVLQIATARILYTSVVTASRSKIELACDAMEINNIHLSPVTENNRRASKSVQDR